MDIRITPKRLIIIAMVFIVALSGTILLGAIFATTGVAVDITASLSEFLPIIFKAQLVDSAPPPGVLVVFSTTATTNGNAGGRTGLADICYSEDLASHLCSVAEIENAWSNNGVVFQSPFMNSWVDNPQFFFDATTGIPRNDWGERTCWGWTSSLDDAGTIISDHASKIEGYPPAVCSGEHHVACCKIAP